MEESNSSKPYCASKDLPQELPDEATPLLVKKTSSTWWSGCVLRYKTTRKCVSSKSALLILFWSFIAGLWNGVAFNPDALLRSIIHIYALAGYGFVALVFCFFPLAGFLADIKYGRYKMVIRSLYTLLISVPLFLIAYGLVYGILFASTEERIRNAILILVFLIMFLASYAGLIGFTANVVQFGMDQLHDSPGEDRTLFIHWYVWVFFATTVIAQLAWNLQIQVPYSLDSKWYNKTGFALLLLISLLVILLLIVTLCLAKHRRNWFLIEPGTINPYRLVYRVTKFAHQHKTPLRRSAFTYCEDEIPTGLDLGKEKYGGPFSTEQVEDVKVFYGILKVLLIFGTAYFSDFAARSVLPYYALHISEYYDNYSAAELKLNETLPEHILLNSSLLFPLLIAICLPLYLCLLRPFISRYVPGMLKRMGLGMIMILTSLMASFAMDIFAHKNMLTKNTTQDICMFQDPEIKMSANLPRQSPLLLIVPLVLTSLSHMLFYTAVLEFICSQSPHSMKGLLIGLLYAIKGLYELLAIILVVPFAVGYIYRPSHMSCGFYYYLVNIVIGVIAVLTYMLVAKKYKYRERDEICDVHRYAEEYYSNPQQEPGYDYSIQ